jgi:hypothetical protein
MILFCEIEHIASMVDEKSMQQHTCFDVCTRQQIRSTLKQAMHAVLLPCVSWMPGPPAVTNYTPSLKPNVRLKHLNPETLDMLLPLTLRKLPGRSRCWVR